MGKREILERMSHPQVLQTSRQAIEEWKKRGQKVMGYTCVYVPEEILYALDILPVRIYGSLNGSTKGESLLQVNICSFVRSCLSKALEGEYEFLDGIIAARTCSQIVKLYDVWNFSHPMPFSYLIDHPHKVSDHAFSYYKRELTKFVQQLEGFTGQRLSEDKLLQAIETCNQNRQLLREISSLRKAVEPPISGKEMMELVRSSTLLPKEQSNALLRELLESLRSGEKVQSAVARSARVLLTGTILDNTALVDLVEDSGAKVVADDLCVGARYFWDILSLNGAPLDSLVRYYLEKTPCACIYPRQKRFQYITEMVREFQVKGVIMFLIKFCDSFTYDNPGLKDRLDELGVPVLELETEYSTIGIGQLKTRIQAFLEVIDKG